jgi:hypothetical protein
MLMEHIDDMIIQTVNRLNQEFIRLRQNPLRFAAGMNDKVHRALDRKAKAGWLRRNSA